MAQLVKYLASKQRNQSEESQNASRMKAGIAADHPDDLQRVGIPQEAD